MEWKIEMEFQLNALRFSLVIAGLTRQSIIMRNGWTRRFRERMMMTAPNVVATALAFVGLCCATSASRAETYPDDRCASSSRLRPAVRTT